MLNPQDKCSAFPPIFIFLLYSVGVCVFDIFCCSRLGFLSCGGLFIGMFHGLLYFIYRQFLVFELRGDSCLEGLSLTTSKSVSDDLLEKPLTALLLTVYQVRKLLEKNFIFC